MAVKSSINFSSINKSVGSLRSGLSSAQKSATKVNSSILQRNRFKRDTISKKSALFIQRRVATRRKESQDAAEATTSLGVRRSPAKIASISTRGFFGRMMDISGALFAGWLVGNLPNIINLAEATSRRAVEVSRVLGGAVNSFTEILRTLFTGLGTIGSSLLRGDITSIPGSAIKSIGDIQNSFTNMLIQLEDAYKVLTQPLDFSKDIEELRERLGLEVPSGTPGPGPGPGGGVTAGGTKYPQLAAAISAGEGGLNSVNRGTAGDTPGGAKSVLGKDLTEMTVGEVMRAQRERRVFAVGKYQFIPGTLAGAVEYTKIPLTAKFDSNTQNKLFDYLIEKKRPIVGQYLTGKSNNKREAIQELAREFAAVGLEYPEAGRRRGQSRYAGIAGNAASISPEKIGAILDQQKSAGPQVLTGGTFRRNQDVTGIVGIKGSKVAVITSLRGEQRKHGPHGGIDIATDEGTYIALRANGVVTYAGNRGGYGLLVDIWIESYGIKLRMAHCSSILPNCKVGAMIPAGVSFARVGNTGESRGPHIHLEADTNKNGTMNGGRDYGGNVDPGAYIPLLLLTPRQSNGFMGTTANGKPAAQINRPSGTGGGAEVAQSLTPERKGQDVIVMSTPQQQQVQQPASTGSSTPIITAGESLNNLYNKILLTQLAYT